jgi:hypothetical protein
MLRLARFQETGNICIGLSLNIVLWPECRLYYNDKAEEQGVEPAAVLALPFGGISSYRSPDHRIPPDRKASPPRPVARPRQEISASGLRALTRRHGEHDGDGLPLFLSFVLLFFLFIASDFRTGILVEDVNKLKNKGPIFR